MRRLMSPRRFLASLALAAVIVLGLVSAGRAEAPAPSPSKAPAIVAPVKHVVDLTSASVGVAVGLATSAVTFYLGHRPLFAAMFAHLALVRSDVAAIKAAMEARARPAALYAPRDDDGPWRHFEPPAEPEAHRGRIVESGGVPVPPSPHFTP